MRAHLASATAFAVIVSLVTSMYAVVTGPALAQNNASNGCVNQWLFNGVWRARVDKVEPFIKDGQQQGWQVTQTWRNGVSRELSPADSMMKGEELQLSSGNVLEPDPYRQQSLVFNTFAPSGEQTYVQGFLFPSGKGDPNDKPKALTVTFDGAKLATQNKPHFTSSQYNFHYDLGCTASGAAAQAQGGSSQISASPGCMNQWMSNGVWKMRVVAVGPNPADVTRPIDQNGWLVTQEWVNITHLKLYPGVLGDGFNRVAPSNVGDEFLATKNGNNVSSANVTFGMALGSRNVPFLPNVPYTYTQLFAGGTLDPADTPTRLLVTFNADAQNKLQLSYPVPRYTVKPANFRISLACGGTVTMAPGVNAQPSTQPQVATAQTPAPANAPANVKGDPCAMLSTNDVASALGVDASSVGAPQRPSAHECSWAVASHAGAPAQTVVLTTQAVTPAKTGCHGLNCLSTVTQALGPAMPSMPSQIASAFNDAQTISGLGDKAAWKDGTLTVVKADTAFQLLVRGSASPALATSETLARDVLGRLP
ncbi:MAG: hypothetical protein JO322_05825 [Candidatus Eremiobacteraeota bacterium]|nr:hypothetical protein [Candidatus Eremiobacteraeota bacterium]